MISFAIEMVFENKEREANMFRAIARFDQWLLVKCQAFSDWLTKTIGLQEANYKIANVCGAICLACMIVAGLVVGEIIVLVFNTACGLFLAVLLFRIYFIELARDDNVKTRKDNNNFIVFRFLLWGQLLYFVLRDVLFPLSTWESKDECDQFNLWYNMSNGFEIAFVYFVSCSRLPPTTSKAAQWLMKGFMKLVPVNVKR